MNFLKFQNLFQNMSNYGWKLSEISLCHAFEEIKSYFEEFQNFSQNGNGNQGKIVIFIHFSKFQNSFQKCVKKIGN